MLKVFVIAYVAAEFGALIHGMLLELPHGLPDDHALPVVLVALVGELTEVNAVGQHLIDILHEIALGTTPRTLHILRVLGLLELDLAMLAEQFVAITALKGLIWEVATHHTEYFFCHLTLQFVLNFVHLNVKLGDWLWPHNSVHGFVTDNHV